MATMKWTDVQHVAVASSAVEPRVDRVDDGWEALFGDGTRKRYSSLAVAVGALDDEEPLSRSAHIYADESVVGHCVFCGSGDVVARSDDTVECQLCHRAFVVMEQPIYAATPAPDYQSMQIDGTGIEDPNADPVDDAPAFAPPPEAAEDPAADPGKPKAEVPGTESPFEKKESSMMFRTAKGHTLERDDFVRHVAITFTRAANTKG